MDMIALAALGPAEQVARILAGTPAGEVPDLPPFLLVTPAVAAARAAWWKENPPPPPPRWAPPVYQAPPTPEVAAITEKQKETAAIKSQRDKLRLAEYKLRQRCEAAGLDIDKMKRWNVNRSRWDYRPVEAALAALPPDVERRMRDTINTQRRIKAKLRG